MPLDPSGAIAVQAFYGIRSERQLMEQLDYNRLYCWFAGAVAGRSGLGSDRFTKNRERLQTGNVFTKLMNKNHPQIKLRLSDEHFRWTGL
jgi:transposase